MAGSENHLRAFVAQLTARGEIYVPQHISQERFEAIVANAGNRSGNRGARGNGNGRRAGHRGAR